MNLLPQFILDRIEHRPNLAMILDNIGWLFLDKILRMGVGLIVGVWVARYLGPEQFGQLNYTLAFVSLFGAFATMGLNGIVVREIVRDPDGANTTLGTAFVLQLIGGMTAAGLIIVTIVWLRPEDELTRLMVAILGLTLVFKSSEVIKYWFESQVQSRYTVWVQNAVFLVIASVKVAMIISEAPLIAFVWVILAEAFLVALGLLAIYASKGGHLRQWKLRIEHSKTLLKDSWPLIISGVSIIAYMKIDQVMLGEMLGNEAVGIYNVAVVLSEVWYFIPIAINQSVMPALFRSKEISQELFLNRLQRQFDLMIWLAIPVALLVTIFSKDIVGILYGSQYSESSSVLVVHIWAGVFVFLNNAAWGWYYAENKQSIANLRITIGLVMNVALNYILIPFYGVVGAAVATLISRFFIAYVGQLLHRDTRLLFIMMSKSLFFGRVYAYIK